MSDAAASQLTNAKKRWPGSRRKSSGPDHSGSKRPKQLHLRPAAPGIPLSGGRANEGMTKSRPDTPNHPGPTGQLHPATPGAKLERRSVATWTYQANTEPPVSYFSAAPWKKQERARVSKRNDRLFAPFQGRTVTEMDRRSNGASLPPSPGSVFCECGGLVVHESHTTSRLHRQRSAALGDGAPTPKAIEPQTNAATESLIQRAKTDPQFARWLLEAAAGTTTQTTPLHHSSPGTSTWPAETGTPTTPAAGGGDCSLVDLDFAALMAE